MVKNLARLVRNRLMRQPRNVNARKRHIAKGQPILHEHEAENCQYFVTDGEVVIFRNGRPIDLVECDEVLDMMLWPNATVMALSDCTLVAMTRTDSQGEPNENNLRPNLYPASV